MNWYTARCLFRSGVPHGSRKQSELVEYRYFLLRARDDQSALVKAWKMAKGKEHRYLSASNTEVNWTVDKVLDVKEILANDIREGVEVFYEYAHHKKAAKRQRINGSYDRKKSDSRKKPVAKHNS